MSDSENALARTMADDIVRLADVLEMETEALLDGARNDPSSGSVDALIRLRNGIIDAIASATILSAQDIANFLQEE